MKTFLEDHHDWHDLANQLVHTARKAGQVQLEIYSADFEVLTKKDNSPVSEADIASEKIILDDLAKIAPNIPVLAEESVSEGYIPLLGEHFFCVDPLDGTKEFIQKNDEFTINIALIEAGKPVFGLVYAPALEILFVTTAKNRAVKGKMRVNDPVCSLKDMDMSVIRARSFPPSKGLSVVTSRSHMSSETEDYLKQFEIAELKSAGSSLKLCMVATGEADLYPRLAPTMEWDIAAGHAIILAAGGNILTKEGKEIEYNKQDQKRPFLNPHFIAMAPHFIKKQQKETLEAPTIFLGGSGQDLSRYADKVRQSYPIMEKACLVTAMQRLERLQAFTRSQPALAVILASQYDGLTRWMRQDIVMASMLGTDHIIIGFYDLEDGQDPEKLLEFMKSEVEQFISGINLSLSVNCVTIDDHSLADKEALFSQILTQFSDQLSAETGKWHRDKNPNQTSDQFSVYLAWYGKEAMLPGRSYHFSLAGQETFATISALKYQIDPLKGTEEAAKILLGGEVACCNIELDQPLGFEPFLENRYLGQFCLSDKKSGKGLAWGWIDYSLARATNLRWQPLAIDKAARSSLKKQKPFILWFTGLSGCGKSTIASLLEKKLHAEGKHTYVLDGDNIRHGLCRDLGFVDADRVENMRRVSETARLFVDAGLIVMVAFISPFQSERQMARKLFEKDEFLEVFVDTPLEICEARDIKGLYKKARAGQIPNFTGISSPFERPENADIHLDGRQGSAEEMMSHLYDCLISKGFV